MSLPTLQVQLPSSSSGCPLVPRQLPPPGGVLGQSPLYHLFPQFMAKHMCPPLPGIKYGNLINDKGERDRMGEWRKGKKRGERQREKRKGRGKREKGEEREDEGGEEKGRTGKKKEEGKMRRERR